MSDQRTRVRALLAVALHPNTPPAEAENALALASKLMLKHGLSDDDIAEPAGFGDDHDVVLETVTITGPYRVRRIGILYTIAVAHSCSAFRDFDSADGCIMRIFGRSCDIFAARTLFAAAEVLSARLLPVGGRSARTSWFRGFESGLQESLGGARTQFVAETPGAGLVLADRADRAARERRLYLRTQGIHISGGTSWVDTSSGDFGAGASAGRSFGGSGRSFGSGVRGELG
ncbi:MAG: DUF2786 domain-containing protein [Actinobacteria bacterium]|nr:DUF2786 domain-containing protein [Actinomycetota bacterium]